MKKINLIVLFIAFNYFLNAQSDLFWQVKKIVKENHPEINLENKLISVNFWSVSNLESRESNKQFNKAFNTYEFAKLKGGLKGLVCVSVNNESEAAITIMNKDGASKLISLTNIKITNTNNVSNIVFDSNGNKVYENIPSIKIVESINKLITR